MRQGSVGLEAQASGTLASSLLSHVHRVPLVSCLRCLSPSSDPLHDPRQLCWDCLRAAGGSSVGSCCRCCLSAWSASLPYESVCSRQSLDVMCGDVQSGVRHLADLGCGTFGNVWLGHNSTFGKVAVKTVKVWPNTLGTPVQTITPVHGSGNRTLQIVLSDSWLLQ